VGEAGGTAPRNASRWAETAEAFVRSCYDQGWVVDCGWPRWKQTDDAQSLARDRDRLVRAMPDDLARLLTTLIRQDRYCDGSLVEAYDCGLLTAILRRAERLTKAP
jgi:hypothetical protein